METGPIVLPVTPRASTPTQVDEAVDVLTAHKDEWARLAHPRRLSILSDLRRRIGAVADAWGAAGAVAKGIPVDSPTAGEEWLGGPYTTLLTVAALHRSIARLWRGETTFDPDWVSPGPGGRILVNSVPVGLTERLLFSGYTGEVWIGPEHRATPLGSQTGAFYREPAPEGKVCVVLGAGNISAIPALDALYKLFVEGQVVVVKMSPVLDYLGAIFERMFEPLIEPGFLRIVYGGGDVGAGLVAHPGVDTVHITGSEETFNTIVFGPGEEGRRRRAADQPLLAKPISSELGGVSPLIVVPGPWNEADLKFQAELVATAKLQNAGFNCIAAQVMILPDGWEHTDAFVDRIEQTIAALPARAAYYPGAEDRCDAAIDSHGDVALLGGEPPRAHLRSVPAGDPHPVFTEEVFASVLASTLLPHRDPADFLAAAVHFANQRLHGTPGGEPPHPSGHGIEAGGAVHLGGDRPPLRVRRREHLDRVRVRPAAAPVGRLPGQPARRHRQRRRRGAQRPDVRQPGEGRRHRALLPGAALVEGGRVKPGGPAAVVPDQPERADHRPPAGPSRHGRLAPPHPRHHVLRPRRVACPPLPLGSSTPSPKVER